MNQSELEENACYWRQARENACEQVTISFGSTFDWLRKWCKLSQPITERSKATPPPKKNMQITFDSSLKLP